MKLNLLLLLLFASNAKFGAHSSFLLQPRGVVASLPRPLWYKSDPDSLDIQFQFTSPFSTNDDGNNNTPSQRRKRRSFLHQLDRFLTLLQGTHSHLKKHTFLSGNFAPVSEEHVLAPVKIVEGSLPGGLCGAFVRNGPNPILQMQKKRYHWFDGHAMLHTLIIKDGNYAAYTNQFIPCPRYQIEVQELGEEYFPTIGEYKGLVGLLKLTIHPYLVKEKISDVKLIAPPNTNILMFNDKLYCLHEANLPMECRMFPDGRLEYVGYETFNGVLDYPVSAHPVKDGEHDLIFHSYSVDEQLIEEHGTMKVGRYNSKHQTVDTYLVPTPSKKHVSFAHSIISTEHFILVWDCSVHFQADALFLGGSFFVMNEKHSLKFGVIPKDATSREDVIWIDSNEAGAIVHPLRAWEEVEEEYHDGKLFSSRTIIKMWTPFSKDLELDSNKLFANTFYMVEYSIDVHAKSVTREVIDQTINSEFSVMPPRVTTNSVSPSQMVAVPSFPPSSDAESGVKLKIDKHLTVKQYSTLLFEDRFGFTAILGRLGHFIGYAKWDLVHRCLDSSVYYGNNEIGGEPTVVRGTDNTIYIGCYVYNEEEGRSYFILYNGETNEKVCRLQMPYRVPFGFHSQFISGEDLQKHFEYHEEKKLSTLKGNPDEEVYRRLVQQMMTMLTFP